MSVLRTTDLFWLTLKSGDLALCVAHRDVDAVEKSLWSHASYLGSQAQLKDLDYQESDEHHPDDMDLHQAFEDSEHAGQYFKRATVNGLLAVGIAGSKKNRDRAARVVAALALVITSSDPRVLESCIAVWDKFGCLADQAKNLFPKVDVALPTECVFWVLLQSTGQRVLCVAHAPQVGASLWSSAMNIGGAHPALRELEYHDCRKGNTEDEKFWEALKKNSDAHADIPFTKTTICDMLAVGLGWKKKDRSRTARVAAAIGLCITVPDSIHKLKTHWPDFPSLVTQAKACQIKKKAILTPCRARPESLSPSTFAVHECTTPHVRNGSSSCKPFSPLANGRTCDEVLHVPPLEHTGDANKAPCQVPRDDGIELSEEPSPITPPRCPRSSGSTDDEDEDMCLDEEAQILRFVFHGHEFDDDEDIEALKGAMRVSLRRFKPSRESMVKMEPEENAQPSRQELEEDCLETYADLLSVNDLKFTHDSVAPRFRDGKSFRDLLCDLRTGKADPEKNLSPLKIYHWPGQGYYSRDNRRLKCLKDFQTEVPEKNIRVQAKVFVLPVKLMTEIAGSQKLRRMLSDFLPALTTVNNGKSVEVRPRHYKRGRWK